MSDQEGQRPSFHLSYRFEDPMCYWTLALRWSVGLCVPQNLTSPSSPPLPPPSDSGSVSGTSHSSHLSPSYSDCPLALSPILQLSSPTLCTTLPSPLSCIPPLPHCFFFTHNGQIRSFIRYKQSALFLLIRRACDWFSYSFFFREFMGFKR